MDRMTPVARLPLPRVKTRQPRSDRAKCRTTSYIPRRGAPRTRTGCRVCKIRRIKCDETRPACLKCTSTGRKCEGYPDPCQMVPITQVSSANHRRNDIRSLYIFRLVSEGEMSIHFESSSWACLVLQLAEVYPSVRYSARAIGTMYESYLQGNIFTQRPQGVVESSQNHAILAEYTLAAKLVADELNAQTVPPQVILVCCLLFIWLELLQNNSAMALMHLHNGLNIIKSLHSATNDNRPTQFNSTTLESMGALMYRMFTRLYVQAALHGMPSPTHRVANLWLPQNTIATAKLSRFLSIQDAAASLDLLMSHISCFVREKEEAERAPGFPIHSSSKYDLLDYTRRSLLADLGQWNDSFTNSAFPVNLVGLALLEIQHLTALIILQTVFSVDDAELVEFRHDFKRIVILSSGILDRCTSGNTIKALSLASGLIPALFFTTLKCRDPKVRNEALELLKRTPVREGLWHRDSMVAAAIWKIDTEDKLKTRIYGERVVDAAQQGDVARAYFSGGDSGQPLSVTASSVEGLLSKLGDFV